jgi:3-oxoacyl-[acyl-carrier protein] reductase
VSLAGQVVWVTGAGRGIGAGIALAFAREGCAVACGARNLDEVQETAARCRAEGGRALPVHLDVTRDDAVRQAADAVRTGLGPVDILVNNAGYAKFAPFADLPLAEWERTIDVNLYGVVRCIRAVLPDMMARRRGRIINISSVVGHKAYPNQSAYCASKHALNGLTQTLAIELREHDIAVSAVSPGGVPTQLTEANMPDRDKSEWMTPDDIAHACLYLAKQSPRATTDILVVRRFGSTP